LREPQRRGPLLRRTHLCQPPLLRRTHLRQPRRGLLLGGLRRRALLGGLRRRTLLRQPIGRGPLLRRTHLCQPPLLPHPRRPPPPPPPRPPPPPPGPLGPPPPAPLPPLPRRLLRGAGLGRLGAPLGRGLLRLRRRHHVPAPARRRGDGPRHGARRRPPPLGR